MANTTARTPAGYIALVRGNPNYRSLWFGEIVSLFGETDPIGTFTIFTWGNGSALADAAPSGTVYDPERDGTRLSSLGVHEHWNSAVDKKYSRNLGIDKGIELVAAKCET